MVQISTDNDFESLLKSNDEVIVKYYADWCGSCKLFAPKYKRHSNDENNADIIFLEINANSNSMVVFPNPNNGDFTIQSQIGDIVNITNELGQVIETIELNQQNNFSLQVNHLQSGIYFLVGKTIKQKVIVTK